MATACPIEAENREDNYELELSRVREKIKTKFIELIDCLKARESELLRELDNILTSYLSYRIKLEKVNGKRDYLEKMRRHNEEEMAASPVRSFQGNFIGQIAKEIESIEIPIKPKMVCFECDSNKMLAELNNLDRLVEKVRSGIDYKSKKQPLVSVCEIGNGMEQLNRSHGVTVDRRTGNIYIADTFNHCVKVFNCTGKYLFMFGQIEGEGKMTFPKGVTISGDKVIVSHGNLMCKDYHPILHYKLNGQFVSRISGKGKKKLICYINFLIDDTNGDIYICDHNNNRIQILSQDFRSKSKFGKDILQSPRDVKLSKEYIFVLDESNPCLHLFSYNHILLESVISRGEGMQVVDPWNFFIDRTGNILISDYGSDSILIFSPQFQLFHKISVSNNPMGITVDNSDRIIVVCDANDNCLQIF